MPVNEPQATEPEHAAEDPILGLSSEEVDERIAAGKINVNADLKTKSVGELVKESVCTLFNLINAVMAVLVFLTGSYKNLTFLGLMFLNTGIGIVQSLRSKKMVDDLTLLSAKKAVVVRDGEEVELDLEQIVLDDVVRLGRGDQIPADAVVVRGSAHVNESLLTGESNPVFKQPGSELMSGSFIDAGSIYARVIRVGADSYVARINNEAKYVKKVNSEIMGALQSIVRFASVLMVPIGIALFLSSVSEDYAAEVASQGLLSWFFSGGAAWEDISAAILSTVAALLGMIPQGLVLLTSSVLALAVIRLARKQVLAQQLYCIETLARVDVLCLDKTGTITSGHMEVVDTYALCADGAVRPRATAPSELVEELEFALANIARATSADANETATAILTFFEERAHAGAAPRDATVVRAVPFNSAKKWSGAQFPEGSYVMGAAQFVLPRAVYRRVKPQVSQLADTCRVLAVARVGGFTTEGDIVGAPVLLGFVTIRDEIRASAPETIRYFIEQDVTLNVISGDDPRTVAGIARQVGIPGADQYVDASTLDTPAKLETAAARYHVFGRVTPQQKRDLVVALKKQGHTVAMTGDGVNDVLALKEADCSVAMAAGSDAARNVAEIVLINNDFAAMPDVVDEGRRSINNLQRSAALYLDKTLFSMGLAAICIFLPPYPFQPITMTLINFFCIGFPSFVLALEPNHDRVKGSFLGNVVRRALPASIGVIAASLVCIAATQMFGYSDAELSTLCVSSTCIVGLALIWQLSYPPTPLRWALFIFVVLGVAVGVTVFPEFFNISRLESVQYIILGIAALLGCLIFNELARVLDKVPDRPRRATGFGRGVRVSQHRGTTEVSPTDTTIQRLFKAAARRVEAWRANRELARAQADARAAVKRTDAHARKQIRLSQIKLKAVARDRSREAGGAAPARTTSARGAAEERRTDAAGPGFTASTAPASPARSQGAVAPDSARTAQGKSGRPAGAAPSAQEDTGASRAAGSRARRPAPTAGATVSATGARAASSTRRASPQTPAAGAALSHQGAAAADAPQGASKGTPASAPDSVRPDDRPASAPKRAGAKRVEKSADGITVKMPARKKKGGRS